MPSVADPKACFSTLAKKIPHKVGARTQPCFTPLRMSKGNDVEPSKTTMPFVLTEGSDDAAGSGWTSDLGDNLEKTIPADQVDSLREVYEGYVEWLSLFLAFLLQLSEGKHHINGGPVGLESALRFWVNSLRKYLEPFQCDSGKQLPDQAKEGDATAVITVTPVAFVLVQSDDICISRVLFGTSPSLHQRQKISCSSVMMVPLQHVGRDAVFSRCFTRGKRNQSLVKFFKGWFTV